MISYLPDIYYTKSHIHVYKLNAVIIFAAGDENEQEILLQCYQKCLQLVLTHGISSVVSCYLRTCTTVLHIIIVIDTTTLPTGLS